MGLGEHLVADEKFANGGAAEEGREEVHMEVPGGLGAAVDGALVEAEGVGEGGLKEVVVADGEFAQDFG